MAEMAQVKAGMERRQKREKRKKLEQKKKARVRAAQAVLGTSGIIMRLCGQNIALMLRICCA